MFGFLFAIVGLILIVLALLKIIGFVAGIIIGAVLILVAIALFTGVTNGRPR